jgi:biopolymer transport protein ExbD
VRIPRGDQGSQKGVSTVRRINISVRKDGTPTFGGQAVTWEQLRQKVFDAAAGPTKPLVTLRGDREAAFGGIAHVIQLCQEAKLENVTVQFIKER